MASTPIVPDVKTTQDPLDALLSELLASSGGEEAGRGRGRHNDSGAEVRKTPSTAVGSRQAGRHVEDHDPWKALSDQVNDEISRQIFDDLDKQLDAQMMAELEKCQEEQSRRLDEELDRQIQEQLDAMLDASLGSELRDNKQDGYQYYSDEDEYSSDEDEYELENLPWSEGGEGGIGSLGLGGLTLEDGAGNSDRDMIFGAPKYSQEELQKMVDNLYGEGCTGEQVGPRPGAWGKSRWRPKGDNS